MIRVFLGLGSNLQREQNLAAGLQALGRHFGPLIPSRIYESEPLQGSGQPYFNMVVALDVALPVGALKTSLRKIEAQCGRVRDGSGRCALDIDLLLYGDQVGDVDGVTLPHADILQRAWVLRPLAELAPDLLHPLEQKSLHSLWQAYTGPRNLRDVPLHFPSLQEMTG